MFLILIDYIYFEILKRGFSVHLFCFICIVRLFNLAALCFLKNYKFYNFIITQKYKINTRIYKSGLQQKLFVPTARVYVNRLRHGAQLRNCLYITACVAMRCFTWGCRYRTLYIYNIYYVYESFFPICLEKPTK